ncbi:MAG: amino acid ABC transporter substrate-binding protein [Bdellovibrionales bacterium]|nr:amino acid ABC transporter substrate-binding protein [Bdellovibrionales bacterium]
MFKTPLFFCSLALLLTSYTATANTLAEVQKRKYVKCGVSQGLPGFSNPDSKNQWTGIDVDVCRAIAAATLGDAKKVKFIPLSAKERFTALQSKEIDILSRNTTWTLMRDTSLGLDFAGVTYYDGQGFMVRKKSGIKSAKQLNGATICVNQGTTTELNLADYFKANKLKYKMVVFEKSDEVVAAYDAGRCDAYTTDMSGLYAQRLKLKNQNDHIILPEVISKEPLGPVVRHGDNQWGDIVRWTIYAMVEGEELNITRDNIKTMKSSKNPNVKRLIGIDGNLGKNLGLPQNWAFNILSQVGNYGEVFENNLGSKSPLKIKRGLNALWKDGGIMYSMPVR